MSDQTPPSGEPNPTPPEGSADGVEPGKTPPAADATAETPAETTAPVAGDSTAPPPPPAPAKSRKGLIIGLVAGFVVLALVAGALAVFFVNRGPEKHTITIASSAGGMKRDKAAETQFKQAIDATNKQFVSQFKGTTAKSGLYAQDDSKRGPEGNLLLLALKYKKPSDKNPAALQKQLEGIATSNKLKVTKIPAGEAGGKVLCLGPASGPQGNATCLWVTRDTIGALLPDKGGYSTKQLSKITLAVRADVEKTE